MDEKSQLHERIHSLEAALNAAATGMEEAEKSTFKLLKEKRIDDVDIYQCVYTINQQMHDALKPIRTYVK